MENNEQQMLVVNYDMILDVVKDYILASDDLSQLQLQVERGMFESHVKSEVELEEGFDGLLRRVNTAEQVLRATQEREVLLLRLHTTQKQLFSEYEKLNSFIQSLQVYIATGEDGPVTDNEVAIKVCAYEPCSKTFSTTHPHKLYCSSACSKKASNARHRARHKNG